MPKTYTGTKKWVGDLYDFPVMSDNYNSYLLAMQIFGPEFISYADEYYQLYEANKIIRSPKAKSPQVKTAVTPNFRPPTTTQVTPNFRPPTTTQVTPNFRPTTTRVSAPLMKSSVGTTNFKNSPAIVPQKFNASALPRGNIGPSTFPSLPLIPLRSTATVSKLSPRATSSPRKTPQGHAITGISESDQIILSYLDPKSLVNLLSSYKGTNMEKYLRDLISQILPEIINEKLEIIKEKSKVNHFGPLKEEDFIFDLAYELFMNGEYDLVKRVIDVNRQLGSDLSVYEILGVMIGYDDENLLEKYYQLAPEGHDWSGYLEVWDDHLGESQLESGELDNVINATLNAALKTNKKEIVEHVQFTAEQLK